MQLVERHIIKRSDSRFAPIDVAAFKAKNLYNAANYLVRQAFIFEHRYLGYAEIFHRIKQTEAYKALPDAFGKGIEAIAVRPVWLTFAWSVQSRALAAA
jgi:putative transposase